MIKIKFRLKPGLASASPPIGPMLGQNGVNIMECTKKINEITTNLYDKSSLNRIYVIINPKDKSYVIYTNPLISTKLFFHLKNTCSEKPILSIRYLYEIAKIQQIYHKIELSSLVKSLIGTLNTMKITLTK